MAQQGCRPGDQYALACIVAEMLTGRMLFTGETPPEIMTKHVLEPPPFPWKWPRGVREGIKEVLRKALAKQPEERYPDVLAFVDALASSSVVESGASKRLPQKDEEKFQPDLAQSVESLTTPSTLLQSAENLVEVKQPVAMSWPQMEKLYQLPKASKLSPVLLEKKTWFSSAEGCQRLLFHPHGQVLIAASQKRVFLWPFDKGQEPHLVAKSAVAIQDITISSNGALLALGVEGGQVYLWNVLADGQWRLTERAIFKTSASEWIISMAFSPRGRFLAAGTTSGKVYVWNVESKQMESSVAFHRGWVNQVAFFDEEHILTGGEDGIIFMWKWRTTSALKLWNSSQGIQDLQVLKSVPGLVAATCSKHNRWLCFRGGLTVMGLGSQSGYVSWEGHKGWIRTLAAIPEKGWIVSGGDDGEVMVWEMKSGRSVYTLGGFSKGIKTLTFSPYGRLMAVGEEMGNVSLWKMQD